MVMCMTNVGHCVGFEPFGQCIFCVETSTATLNGYFKKVRFHALEQKYTRHDLMNICQYLSVMKEL